MTHADAVRAAERAGKPTPKRRRVAWLVCWLSGQVQVVFGDRASARHWCYNSCLLTAQVVRVEYEWPPAKPARRGRD